MLKDKNGGMGQRGKSNARQRTGRRRQWMTPAAAAALCMSAAVAVGAAGAELRLNWDAAVRPVTPGDTIVVTLSMADLQDQEAAGFQAFLEFDDAQMFLVGGTYTPEPFGLAILPIVATVPGRVDLASGVNAATGQTPVDDSADLVELVFQATQEFCEPTIGFRTHSPPTLVSDDMGQPLAPLALIDLAPSTCPADIAPAGGDGEVGVSDLLELLASWGQPSPSNADIAPGGCDGLVDVNDLLELLAQWGPCS